LWFHGDLSTKPGWIGTTILNNGGIYPNFRVVYLHLLYYFPEGSYFAGIKWTKPKGGLFLWVTTPECLDCQDFFEDAVKEKVAFVPGTSFFAEGGGHNTMRLNFSNATPEKINEGISRLAKVIKTHLSLKGG
jgi:DNA-binding transcriptional MocR family regulator